MNNSKTAILLIHCPDRRGIVSGVTGFILQYNGNILHLDQHVDFEQNTFFMRMEWTLDEFNLPTREAFAKAFEPVAREFGMTWQIHPSTETRRMALFVSKQPHCLYDILSRHESGEYRVEIPVIVSNHLDGQSIAERFEIPFYHFPITPENKRQQEQRQLELLKEQKIDFVVLARYMQILSPLLVGQYPQRIINIHHSFLPAFPGARPYHSAYARGVKIIGATSHYVTSELDAGPIIEQDIIRVSHKETIEDFIRRGRDLEKTVLARAIWLHLRHQILVYNNKTVLFG